MYIYSYNEYLSKFRRPKKIVYILIEYNQFRRQNLIVSNLIGYNQVRRSTSKYV